MGLRGPAPTPTKVLKARGSWRGKLNSREPRPEPGAPTCPKNLPDAEKKVWRAVCKLLADMGLLSKADGSSIERYCRFYVRWRVCEKFISQHGISCPVLVADDGNPPKGGYLEQTPTGEYVVAWVEFLQVRESHRLHKALKDIEDRFGLSPAARSRVQSLTDNGPRLHDGEGESKTAETYFFGR